MNTGLLTSLIIMIAVAIFFIRYPAFMRRQFHNRPPPPLFRWLGRMLPAMGYLIIALMLLWLALFRPS